MEREISGLGSRIGEIVTAENIRLGNNSSGEDIKELIRKRTEEKAKNSDWNKSRIEAGMEPHFIGNRVVDFVLKKE